MENEPTVGAVLDWAEKAGLENLKFRLQNAETLAKEAATTLTVLLAGIGGALSYAAKYYDGKPPALSLVVGATALAVWLMFLSVLLVHYCVRTLPLQTPTNEPENLYQPKFALDVLREVELQGIQRRINQTVKRNSTVAQWLDRVRYGAVFSPLIFLIAAWVVSLV